jgi:hypothetical protein
MIEVASCEDIEVDDKTPADAEAPDWLVIGAEAEVCLVTEATVALGEGSMSITLHLLPTLRLLSREQLAVVPYWFRKETVPSLLTLTHATCRPSTVPYILTFSISLST